MGGSNCATHAQSIATAYTGSHGMQLALTAGSCPPVVTAKAQDAIKARTDRPATAETGGPARDGCLGLDRCTFMHDRGSSSRWLSMRPAAVRQLHAAQVLPSSADASQHRHTRGARQRLHHRQLVFSYHGIHERRGQGLLSG